MSATWGNSENIYSLGVLPLVTQSVFDLQLANLAVQKIDLRLAGPTLCRRAAALENAHRPIEQLLLPVVDLVRMNQFVEIVGKLWA